MVVVVARAKAKAKVPTSEMRMDHLKPSFRLLLQLTKGVWLLGPLHLAALGMRRYSRSHVNLPTTRPER